MLKKTLICGIIVLILGVIVCMTASKGLTDDIDNPFSTKLSTNIGAWYDEVWLASGFYRLQADASNENFHYAYSNSATTNSNPTFTKGGTGEHAVSIVQDMIITEWRVSGHVHFSSGM
ncbi:MAG: hypothetical protein PHE58_00050 [Candidatus Omnitrophica bacterium]|nr:hypothetical protein [Candidatus Omnitrophota bacterium]